MAAHRIIRVTNNNHILPRCKSEGTLIDLSEGVNGASLNDVKGQFYVVWNLVPDKVKNLIKIHSVSLEYNFIVVLI